ncbi:Chaperone protein HtpG, partial [Dissostichus eleginoides]
HSAYVTSLLYNLRSRKQKDFASDHEEPDSPSAAQREVRLSLLNMLSHLRRISVKMQSCRTPAVSCEEL